MADYQGIFGGGGGGSAIASVVGGTAISVDNTDPLNPVINCTFVAPVTSVNGLTGPVTLTAASVGAAATSHTHAASDVTSGTIETARLGSGTANSTTALFGDQTYKSVVTSVNGVSGTVSVTTGSIGAAPVSHTHAATDITSGVIATARLASAGSASNLTFLRGDQQWASAPVTSVNGFTGAVTVAAGDTAYSLTVQDAENTTATRNLCQFTAAANTILDGEIIIVRLWYHANNMSGVAGNAFNVGMSWTGTSLGEYSAGSLTGGENGRFGIAEFWFARSGTTLGVYNAGAYGIYNSPPYNQMVMGSTFFPAYTNHVLDTRNWTFVSTNFSSNITFSITGRWNTANAAAYVRILNARAVKVTGQQT